MRCLWTAAEHALSNFGSQMKAANTFSNGCGQVQNCRCDASYQLVFPEGDTMPVCLPAAPAFPIGTSIGIAVGGFAFLTLLALVGVWLFVVFWKDLADLAKKRAKLRGPPGELAQADTCSR